MATDLLIQSRIPVLFTAQPHASASTLAFCFNPNPLRQRGIYRDILKTPQLNPSLTFRVGIAAHAQLQNRCLRLGGKRLIQQLVNALMLIKLCRKPASSRIPHPAGIMRHHADMRVIRSSFGSGNQNQASHQTGRLMSPLYQLTANPLFLTALIHGEI